MDLFVFTERYLASLQDYLTLFTLPIHHLDEHIDAVRRGNPLENLHRPPPKKVNLEFLRARLKEIRPEAKYSSTPMSMNGGPKFLRDVQLLGESKAKVWRALIVGESEPVVYKQYSDRDDFDIAAFESSFTHYLTHLRQYDMPKVLHANPDTGKLMKEYVSGFTFKELEEIYQADSPEMAELKKLLELERRILKHVGAGYDSWFEESEPELSQELRRSHPYLVVGKDHHKNDNWLFDPEKGRWILIDP